MVPGFHCSSLEFHNPVDLIPKLAAMGFAAIAIRPRRGGWDFESEWFDTLTGQIAAAASEHGIRMVVDLDGPFYDDPDRIDPLAIASDDSVLAERATAAIARRLEQVSELKPAVVTFSTGRRRPDIGGMGQDRVADEAVLERLAALTESLLRHASSLGVPLALRPVAEHAIATVAHFERFTQWIASSSSLGLAADVGEMLLGHEFPIGARLARLRHQLACVYLCEPDVERGCDQRFGQGDIDLGRVWEVLTESGFGGPAVFRACGHGRVGPALAREAIDLLPPRPV